MKLKKSYDFIVVGSGFGGAFAAYNLAKAGKEVLILERGSWVKRDDSCWDEKVLHLENPMYRGRTASYINQKNNKGDIDWPNDTVGGMSTFYGAAAFRMREDDFLGAPLPDSQGNDTETAWPVGYREFSQFYDEAEKLQGVAGIAGEDITEPKRNSFPQKLPGRLSEPSRRIWDASKNIGLHPFHIPLAINFSGDCGKTRCEFCFTCDHYPCKIEAKNDLTIHVIPEALKHGAVLAAGMRAVKINVAAGKVVSIDVVDQSTARSETIKTKNLIVSCGAIATPHLLISSGLGEFSGASPLIGRYLMRHANGFVSGIFPYKTNPEKTFHKQVAIPDFYYGDPERKLGPFGKWGLIQEIHTPGKGVIKANAPKALGGIAALISDFMINLLCIAEDVPQYENRVYADSNSKDVFGMPVLRIYHRYAKRDIEARAALYRQSKKILRKAGALISVTLPIETFSHAFGTCRFGNDRASSVLDPDCRLWGVGNLYVVDASFMPSGGSVNPSLTIAANALRVSKQMV
jgi:choline dehydrogenase-like flavoprotein